MASNPPPSTRPHGPLMAFLLNMKSAAAVITALAALVVAVGNACKKPEEPGAKAAYEELAKAVKENSETAARNHDDVVALHGYLDGILKAEGVSPPVSDGGKTVLVVDASTPKMSAVSIIPIDRSKIKPPPPVSPRPVLFDPPSYDDIATKR